LVLFITDSKLEIYFKVTKGDLVFYLI